MLSLCLNGSSRYTLLDLPVELVAFNVRVDASSIMLRWNTASEKMNTGFEVQHKVNDTLLK